MANREIAIVGGGPAGLRAAEVAAASGALVTVYDAKPSVGRKFLVAGKGGLNLTHSEPAELFARRYSAGPWAEMLREFGPADLRAWAVGLGVETFVASSGRIYPKELKAAPLLRRWVQRLKSLGVRFAMHHRWLRLQPRARIELLFATAAGHAAVEADAVILALGGASWPETGSDGAWVSAMQEMGVGVTDLQPANCGWEVNWTSDIVRDCEGVPLKNIALQAADVRVRGELMITRYGLEGGAMYQLGAVLRGLEQPEVEVDLKPDLALITLIERLQPSQRMTLLEAARRCGLAPAAVALLQARPGAVVYGTPGELAHQMKHVLIPLVRPRPIDEAISSAGGVQWSELTDDLMLVRCPGVFVAGEMLDWEAPTGGYLLQGCFATGTRAGRCAAMMGPSSDQTNVRREFTPP